MTGKKSLLFWLPFSAILLGIISLCVPTITPNVQSSQKDINRSKNVNAHIHSPPTAASIPTPANWIDRPPVLPAQLIGATPLSSEEVAWDNGAVQRRTVYRQADGAHTLLLETAISSSPLITRYLYTADRLLLVERTENFSTVIDGLRRQGVLVSQPSPDSPHAYVHLQTPGSIFASLDYLKQLVGSNASVQLDQMETKY